MRALIVGIGNRYMGDDGFGPRVIDRLSRLDLPDWVETRDAGLGGITLAVELDEYDLLIVVDGLKMGLSPGEIYYEKIEEIEVDPTPITIHDAGVRELIAFAGKIGTLPPNVYLIGCEVADVSLRDGLSPPVESAIDETVDLILDLLYREGKGE
ncbi:MAG: hydrogenase maturation protease [Candidatus Syntropharchaeia archaeon]